MTTKLQIIQFKCLCIIAEAYRITLIHILKTEIFIFFLNLHLNDKLKTYHSCKDTAELRRSFKRHVNRYSIVQENSQQSSSSYRLYRRSELLTESVNLKK